MHTQKHLHKTHPKHASYTARRQKQLANVRRLRRLCAKSALCTSVFTLTLLVSSEWTIQNPQSDHWSFAQHASSFEQDKQNPVKENTKSSKASDKQAAGHTSKSRRKASSDSKKKQTDNASDSSKEPSDSQENQTEKASDSSKAAGSPPAFAEFDKAKPQQTPGTDERTLYSVNPDTDISYTYEENELQFSSNAGQSIQAVPEQTPEEQRIDTTTDDTETEHYQQASIKWNLILVNPWNEIPDDYKIELTSLPNGHSIDSRCYPALTEMLAACREAGLQPLICSSYRTNEKQSLLFQERIDELAAQGFSKKEARQIAAISVARPGTSEHQAGLAVDIVDSSHQLLDATQEQTPVQQWLLANSWKYGFILRYPREKSSLTGIIYEPWHYRFVGVEAAKEIYEQGICLEEYLEERS